MLLLLSGVALGGSCVYEPAEDGYHLAFEDSFESLDEDVWHFSGTPGGVTVANGVATIRDVPGDTWTWNTLGTYGRYEDGPLHDRDEINFPNATTFQEGYFEARLRFTDNEWSWPAFWLYSLHGTEYGNDRTGTACDVLNSEWDIMEAGIGNTSGNFPASRSAYTVLHRNTSGACGQDDETNPVQTIAPEGVNYSDWHTWSGKWTAEEVCYYLDGVQLECVPTYDTTDQPMVVVLSQSFSAHCGGCGAKPPELTMDVDWVRVWQRGSA